MGSEKPAPLQYVVFGGDCSLTPARALVEKEQDRWFLRSKPSQVHAGNPDVDYDLLMLEPGDGVVTKPSLLAREAVDPAIPRNQYTHFPLDYSFLLCETHDTLTSNVNFVDNLLHVLLKAED